MIFCIDSSLQLAQLSYKADFDLKNAVLRPYLAQIMRVSCVAEFLFGGERRN